MTSSCPELPSLLEGIYLGISRPEALTWTLHRLTQITGARFSTFAVPTPDFHAFAESQMVGDFEDAGREKLQAFERENPGANTVLRFARLHPDATWFDTHATLPRDVRDADPFLNFTAAEIGTPRWCATFLPTRLGLGMGIALNYRSPEDATARNADLQRRLFNHLVHAHRLSCRSPLLDAEADPIFLLDGYGRVIHENAAAVAALDSPDPVLCLRLRRLRVAGVSLQSRLDALVSNALTAMETGWSGGALPLRGDDPARRRMLAVTPLPGHACLFGSLAARVMVRLFLVPGPDEHRSATLLRDHLPLTSAEARFALSFLKHGGDIRVAAADLGICYNTARVHLYRIFDKAGVRSQGQLLLLLERLHRAL